MSEDDEEEADVDTTDSAKERRINDLRYRVVGLEIAEYAYDQSVISIEFGMKVLDWCSVVLSIHVLMLESIFYLLSNTSKALDNTVAVIAKLVAFVLLSVSLWNLIDRRRSKLEVQHEIARRLHSLVAEIQQIVLEGEVSSQKFTRLRNAWVEIESDEKDVLAKVSQKHFIAGFRHVAKKYPHLGLKCSACNRDWHAKYDRQRQNWLKQNYCSNCGVNYEQ